ncbi:MAG: M23 family metallopeptidase [Patescibacteria group bacterium]|nr:M23 family metallopeptidase [Patescibacteria group bacterium]
MALFLIIFSLITISRPQNNNTEIYSIYGIMGGPNEENFKNNSQDQTILRSNSLILNNQSLVKNDSNIDFSLFVLNFKELGLNNNQNKILNYNQNFDKVNNTNLSEQKINFILPTRGLNWGKLHPKNAVDIAASCGNDVLAAADGLIIDLSNSGWNNGYGKYIKIEHLNNVKTIYAHLNSINVSIGNYVKQGQKIGTIGQTGEATGCHVHFEVLGDKNPFIKSN